MLKFYFKLHNESAFLIEPINQCTAIDSTFFDFDLTPPSFVSADISTSPATFGCNTDSMEISANLSGSILSWVYDNDPTIPLPNPFQIYSTDSLNFTATALKISNGCTADQPFVVQTSYVIATPDLVGYPNFDTQTIDDTLSCLENLLTLECATNPPTAGTASWLHNGVNTGLPTLDLSEADSAGMFFNTNTFQFVTTHNNSGCKDTTDIVIYFDLDAPFIFEYPGSESLNCSQDSLLLVHPETGGNVAQGWLDALGTQTGNDSLTALTTGDYIFEVLDLESGCLARDTVSVTQTFDMDVQLPEDTLICPNESINLMAIPTINTGETPTFLWSNGSTTNTSSATGSIDSQLSLITQTNSGCISYDTISINITAPISIATSSASGCSSGVLQIDSISGGAGGYSYSLDNSTWQANPSFSGLDVGPHIIYVQDALGCVYDFPETIEPNGQTLDVNFLVSTYNETGDTIAFVNISSFTGFDSLEWILPSGSTLLFSSDSTLLMTVNVDGWYEITLIGYLDSCSYSKTKSIYFGPEAPVFNEDHEDFGITNFIVYPNPTNGTFTLEVAFGTAQNYSVFVRNSAAQPINGMYITGTGTEIMETFTFPVGSASGAYIIHVIGDYDAKQETILLN